MADATSDSGVPAGGGFGGYDLADPGGGVAWEEMTVALRACLDAIAGSKPDDATIAALRDDLAAWTRRLAPAQVTEARQIFGRRAELAGRGQTMVPPITYHDQPDGSLTGSVTFGRFFLGGNGAAHGGAVALMFDEVLGRIANQHCPVARTAYLRTDFRSITPIDVTLAIRASRVGEAGRKRIVRAELRHGDTLCAEAEALFVTLLPGQP